MLDRLDEIPYENILADLTVEDAAKTRRALSRLDAKGTVNNGRGAVFRGHHYKGVE